MCRFGSPCSRWAEVGGGPHGDGSMAFRHHAANTAAKLHAHHDDAFRLCCITQPCKAPGTPTIPTTRDPNAMTILAVRHTGIVVSDMQRSLHFYRDLLGMEVWADFQDESDYVQSVTEVTGAKVWMIKLKAADGVSIELLQYLSHPSDIRQPPSKACDVGVNHIALQVDDIDSLHTKLVAEGIRFHAPPTLSGDGGAKVTYCRDPEGVIVELVQILNP